MLHVHVHVLEAIEARDRVRVLVPERVLAYHDPERVLAYHDRLDDEREAARLARAARFARPARKPKKKRRRPTASNFGVVDAETG